MAARFREQGGTVLEPRSATDNDLARVHTREHIAGIVARRGRASMIDEDTFTSPDSDDIARLAAGAALTAGPEVKRVIAPAALDRFKQRTREITRRAKGVSMETTMAELAPYLRGLRGYFGFCETQEALVNLTRWVRVRLRAALWRQWKTPKRRRAALLHLGVRGPLASQTAGSGRGPWYLARSKALSVGLSNAYFRSPGFPSLFDEC